MKRRAHLVALLVLFSGFLLNAGDIANFVNLGFSEDSHSFMFGIHGIDEKTLLPWAEIYMVDVSANTFINKGVAKKTGSKPIGLGQDGAGELYSLIGSMNKISESYKIDHSNSGRIVYILLDGRDEKGPINFRDFNTGNSYKVILTQSANKENREAEFSIQVSVNQGTSNEKATQVGRPNYFRKNVDEYKIRQIILSPDESSLVFVIEKIFKTKNGFDSSFMVETVKIF